MPNGLPTLAGVPGVPVDAWMGVMVPWPTLLE